MPNPNTQFRPLDYSEYTVKKYSCELEAYLLSKPDTGFEMFNIIFDPYLGKLIIYSDLEDAIYMFGVNTTFEQIARVKDINYFANKCTSSSEGKGYRIFSILEIEKRLKERYNYLKENYIPNKKDLYNLYRFPSWKKTKDLLKFENISSREEWHSYLEKNYHRLLIFLNCDQIIELQAISNLKECNCDQEELWEIKSNWGMVPSDYCRHHLDAVHAVWNKIN
jgi:hypothetical protein